VEAQRRPKRPESGERTGIEELVDPESRYCDLPDAVLLHGIRPVHIDFD